MNSLHPFTQKNGNLLLYPSPWRVYAGAVLVIFFSIAYGLFSAKIDSKIALGLSLPLFCLIVMALLLLIRMKRPYLILAPKNLIKNSVYGLWPKRTIPWNQIIEITAMELNREKIVRIKYSPKEGENRYAVIWTAHLPLKNTQVAEFLHSYGQKMKDING